MAQWVAILRHGRQLTIYPTYLSSVVLADDLSPQEYDIIYLVDLPSCAEILHSQHQTASKEYSTD